MNVEGASVLLSCIGERGESDKQKGVSSPVLRDMTLGEALGKQM